MRSGSGFLSARVNSLDRSADVRITRSSRSRRRDFISIHTQTQLISATPSTVPLYVCTVACAAAERAKIFGMGYVTYKSGSVTSQQKGPTIGEEKADPVRPQRGRDGCRIGKDLWPTESLLTKLGRRRQQWASSSQQFVGQELFG